jgi:hypothetical protein
LAIQLVREAMAAKELKMSEPEDIVALPPFFQGVIDGMKQAIRQKWYEATTTYLARAVINHRVAVECRTAGFHDAGAYFTQKSIWLLAQGVDCYGKMLSV